MVRRKGAVDVIVESGGRTCSGDEVGDLGGVFCGDSPRRRSSEDILAYNMRGTEEPVFSLAGR